VASWHFNAFLNYGETEDRRYVLYQTIEKDDKWNQQESLNWILEDCRRACEVLLKQLEEKKQNINKNKLGKIELVKKEIDFLNKSIEIRNAK
jgi:hypothetical protein